jgi:hypothetical protein
MIHTYPTRLGPVVDVRTGNGYAPPSLCAYDEWSYLQFILWILLCFPSIQQRERYVLLVTCTRIGRNCDLKTTILTALLYK